MWYTRWGLLLVALSLGGCGLFGSERERNYDVLKLEGPDFVDADTLGWTAEREDEWIFIRGSAEAGASFPSRNGAGSMLFILRVQEEGGLPELVDVWVGNEGEPGQVAHQARLRLQDWDPEGIISGYLEMRFVNYTFYGGTAFFWAEVPEGSP